VPKKPLTLSIQQARRLWLQAQRLDTPEPFGAGAEAVAKAVSHLGYVQIDTINVIERCHHHILYSRIPDYRRADLETAQSIDKSVFEYWTHALAYVATADLRFFLLDMKRHRENPQRWYTDTAASELRRVLRTIRRDGAQSIRDFGDEELVEKNHPWASRKPAKRALQLGFYNGDLTISARTGMLKTYELIERHFGWQRRPRAATEGQVNDYILDRALRAQGLVTVDSVCFLDAKRKPAMRELIDKRVRGRKLKPVAVAGLDGMQFWATPAALAEIPDERPALTHILSPFDPLIIQRKRTSALFGYDHLFEAYLPKAKRQFGYFALPVLVGEEIVAVIDLKADRTSQKLLIQQWTWTGTGNDAEHRPAIEAELERFSAFQFGD
jgi:uncharacterized protein YcaQ